jgi:PKD repeat protein
MLGNEVMNVVNVFKQAGNYSASVDASSLASGVYFYKMETNGFVDSKKMILLK